MHQCHVDALCAFCVTMHLVGSQDQFEVDPILFLLTFTNRRSLHPGIIATS